MSEQAEQVTQETPVEAFGASFEEALAAAYTESDTPIEVAVVEKTEPVKKEPEVKEKAPETVEEVVVEEEEHDIKLPIDEEVAEVEEEADTTGMTKSAGERFKGLRTELKVIKTDLNTKAQALAAAEAKIKEFEANSGVSEEVQKKLEQYELELSVSRLEATEAYKNSVTKPLAAIAGEAETLAAKYSIDVDKLLDAISLTDTEKQDEAFADLLDGVNDRDRLKVYSLSEKLPAIFEQRTKLHDNSAEALKELEATKQSQSEAELLIKSKERAAAVDLVATRVAKALPFLSTSGKFDLEVVKSGSDTDYDTQDITTKAYNAYAGKLVPQLAKAYLGIMKEVEELTNELDKHRKADPSFKDGKQPTGVKVDDKDDFVSSVEKRWSELR